MAFYLWSMNLQHWQKMQMTPSEVRLSPECSLVGWHYSVALRHNDLDAASPLWSHRNIFTSVFYDSALFALMHQCCMLSLCTLLLVCDQTPLQMKLAIYFARCHSLFSAFWSRIGLIEAYFTACF